jgi:hypothetical protein
LCSQPRSPRGPSRPPLGRISAETVRFRPEKASLTVFGKWAAELALRNMTGRWRSEPTESEPGVRAILDPCVAGFDRFEFKFRPKRSDFGRKKVKSAPGQQSYGPAPHRLARTGRRRGRTNPQEKAALRGTTLSDVLRRNVTSGGEGFPDDVFRTVPAAAAPPPAVEPANWQIFEFHDTGGHLIRIAGVVPYTPQNGLHRLIVPSHGVDTALVAFDTRNGRFAGVGGNFGFMPRVLIPFFTSGFLQARPRLFEFTDAAGNLVRILGPGRHEDGRPRQMPAITRWPLDGANAGSLGIWSGFDSVTGQYQVRNQGQALFEVRGTAPEGTVPQGRREELRAFERSLP